MYVCMYVCITRRIYVHLPIICIYIRMNIYIYIHGEYIFRRLFFGGAPCFFRRHFVLAQERKKERSDAYVERKQDPKP